jgi:hypothetical protein
VTAVTEQAMRSLDQRTAELAAAYIQSSQTLKTSFDEGSTGAVTALVTTNDRLKNELSGVIDRLQGANQFLRQVSADASGNLSAVEHGLAVRAEQIRATFTELAEQTGQASDQVAAQVDALKAVSVGALRQAAELVIALDERGRNLSESTREQLHALADATLTLERIEGRMNEALADRREALETVLNEIEQRSEELQSTTRSFTSSLDDTLRDAQTRARQIGAVLSDSSQAASSAIGERFDQIRSTTDEEGARTTAALRATYEQVTADMSDALANVTSRFREATDELRAMAAQIHKELEETRAELRRGVLDLPQETQETTGEMRRVMADQIKALNELAALVSRSNRAVDAAPPLAQPRRADTAALAPEQRSAAAGGGRFAEVSAPAARYVAPVPRPADAPPQQPARRGNGSPRQEERTGQERTGQERTPQGRDSGGGQGRWISDLLSRASREDQPEGAAKPPARSPERPRVSSLDSLDSISGDIAKMIDHDAAVELWDRYRRGEHNVFSRRLYTIDGQQTFDDIRRKYRRETDFKQTVDRYVDEFERLLAEATRDDRDPTLARSYLTSETGKVYTMLAHASGRFD